MASKPVEKTSNTPKSTDSVQVWKPDLDDMAKKVLFQCGTEPPFSGKYWNHHEVGVYRCAACGTVLFQSSSKFDSGSGWPSFFDAADPAVIRRLVDRSHGMERVELRCAKCDGHLGHVFEDGPRPTGLRYCINSASLVFEARSK